MRLAYLGFTALGLIAGSAGFVLHQHFARAPVAPLAAPRPAGGVSSPAIGLRLIGERQFADLEGKPRALATWAGKLVVLNFWATWCPPCLKEIPAFVELQARYGARGLQFVGIALDEQTAVRPFVAERGITYPILLGDQDVAQFMAELGNDVGGLPYTVVVSPTGEVLLRHRGEWLQADAEAYLKDALAQP